MGAFPIPPPFVNHQAKILHRRGRRPPERQSRLPHLATDLIYHHPPFPPLFPHIISSSSFPRRNGMGKAEEEHRRPILCRQETPLIQLTSKFPYPNQIALLCPPGGWEWGGGGGSTFPDWEASLHHGRSACLYKVEHDVRGEERGTRYDA